MGNCQGQARSSTPSNLSAQVKPTLSTMGVSPPWQPALKTLVIDPMEKHTATVVFLHGLGDTGQGWAEDLPSFNLKHIKWIVPTAEERPITWNGGMRMNGWFDVRGLGPGTHEDVEGLDRAAAHVVFLLEEERAAAGPDSPILYAVGGFSQGGSLALHVATSLAYGRDLSGRPTPDVPLSAALCISGWLRGSSTLLKTPPSAEALRRAASLPILHCHGTADPTVSFRLGKDTADTLKGVLGFSRTTFKPYMLVGHHVVPEEIADIRIWMLTHLPPT